MVMSSARGATDLDDPAAMGALDTGDMLRACASSGAQIRSAVRASAEAGLDAVTAEGRPRAVVVTGMGGSGISGNVLGAVTGNTCPIPVVSVKDFTLPGWVGPMDLVIGVSCSGVTEETLSATDEAVRRGARIVTVGAANSPLARLAERGRGVHIAVDAGGRQPRASMWTLSAPLLCVAHALGLADIAPDALQHVADLLDADAERFGPGAASYDNPAKELAVALVGALPVVWGVSRLTGVVAYRFCCQLNENAKYPGVPGELPEAGHNQIVTFDGPFSRAVTDGSGGEDAADDGSLDDFFRDRADDGEATRTRLVLLREDDEHPRATARASAVVSVAMGRDVPVTQVRATGATPVERLASLVSLTDFASTYLALALGLDPSPIGPINELKGRIAT